MEGGPAAKPPPRPGAPRAWSLHRPISLPPPDHPGAHPTCLPHSCGEAGGAFTPLARGLTPLPQNSSPRLRSPCSVGAKTFSPACLQRAQAAKSCFEYQGFPKIKKEKRVFWKHLRCQLIKCLITNKLPRRGRERQPASRAPGGEAGRESRPHPGTGSKCQLYTLCTAKEAIRGAKRNPQDERGNLQNEYPVKGSYRDCIANSCSLTTKTK